MDRKIETVIYGQSALLEAICTNDSDVLTVQAIRDGNVEACTSHDWFDMVDIAAKLMLTTLCVGADIPHELALPTKLITPENLYTVKQYGCTAVWPLLPENQENLWPILDTTEIGVPTPTKAMREELQGY